LSNDPLADFNLEANRKLNTLDSINLAHVCADQKVPKFVFASSASVYGMEDDKLSHESDHVYPYSNYAKSKREAEVAFLEMHGLHPVILRKGTVMGVSPRMRFDLVVNTMMKEATQFKKIRLLGGGENWRPLVDIRDVVELYHSIIMMSQDEYDKVSGNIYNVVGENFRISELGLRIGSLLDVPVVPDYSLPRDVRSYRLDGGLAEAKLHFKPQHKLVSTVRDIEGWIRSRSPDFEDPIYYNIKWIKACQRVCNIIGHDYDITQ
jgi:nucleoside-diphosphate-sugar epimerase